MRHSLYLLPLFLLSLTSCLSAQQIALTPAYPPVTFNGEDLPLAWFGGLNTPQPQSEDLDGDGTPDLFIFDKAGEVHLAMKGDGSGNYEEAPELVRHFPKDIEKWMMLRDYNRDGTPDIFAYRPQVDAVKVYQGKRRPDGLLEFELLDFGQTFAVLHYPFEGVQTPIFVSNIDYPAIDDLDYDGDLDLITFSVNGGNIQYFKNQSIERGFGTDTMIFTFEERCWGGFFESGLTTALDLSPAPGGCFTNLDGPDVTTTGRHSGSTITTLDYSGNGRKDVFLGDVSFNNLVLGFNTGTVEEAWISAQDTAWNDDGVITDIRSFPTAFHIDVDQDGVRDLVASPSATLNGDDVRVMWYYRNEGTEAAPDFVFKNNRQLVDRMLDFGTSANVTTFDYDADGRTDLVVGNNDEFIRTNGLDSRLRVLRNVTPAGGEIAFALVDEDYLGMSAFQSTGWAFAPTFGDMDDDGDLDVVIGDRGGKLFYGENTAGPGNPATFAQLVFEWRGIDAGQFSKPHIADLDRDGLNDLLVGGFDGRIRFYRNVGTATAPVFDPDVAAEGNMIQLGGINANTTGVSTGHPNPWVIQNPDYTLVMAGDRAGGLQVYRFGIDSAYTDPFTLVTRAADSVSVGGFSNPGFADFDGDGKLELVMGTQRGGVTFFRTNLNPDATTSLFAPVRPTFDFTVAPNPASGVLTVSGWPAGEVSTASLLDINGRTLRTMPLSRAGTRVRWEVDGLVAGVYLVRLSGPGGVATRKVVVR